LTICLTADRVPSAKTFGGNRYLRQISSKPKPYSNPEIVHPTSESARIVHTAEDGF